MSDKSKIQWTDATWNPVVGCSRVHAGCDHCYAVTMSHRLEGMGQEKYRGLTVLNKKGDRHFNGVVRTSPEALTIPLSWRNPRRVFVNSMSDLFHAEVPFEFIDRVMAVMALCPRQTFQVLTKRPERAAKYFASFEDDTEIDGVTGIMRLGHAAGKLLDGGWIWGEGKRFRTAIEHFISDAYGEDEEETGYEAKEVPWPLPNLWLGTSVSDQKTADAAIPHLLRCPAAVRFVSYEPALGPLDFTKLNLGNGDTGDCLNHRATDIWTGGGNKDRPWGRIHWLIVGGESGSGARPFDVAWARSSIEQCRAACVPCFVKQMGSNIYDSSGDDRLSGRSIPMPKSEAAIYRRLNDPKGGDCSEWPNDLRVREWPEVAS